MASDDELRDAARHRIMSRRNFYRSLLWQAIIVAFLIVIWAVSGMGYFWPVWPIVGLLLGTGFMAFSTFGPGSKPLSDSELDAEVRRLKGE